MERNFWDAIESKGRGVLELTPREKRLLRRFAQGKTDKKIAQEMGDIEERIAARITEKLQIRSPDELVAMAERLANWPNRSK